MSTNKLSILLLFLTISSTSATSGLDITTPTPKATFECLKKNGFNFVIPALQGSFGHVDPYGPQSVKDARAAGLTDVDGGLLPCTRTGCETPENQVKQTLNAISTKNTTINVLWIKVQQLAWSPNLLDNRFFIESMVKQAQLMNQQVGIYTSYYDWQSVVGLDYYGLYAFPLWWKNYDGVEDFRYFVSFGGWTRPYIHQYKNREDGPCNVSMQRDWKQ